MRDEDAICPDAPGRRCPTFEVAAWHVVALAVKRPLGHKNAKAGFSLISRLTLTLPKFGVCKPGQRQRQFTRIACQGRQV